ncbi:hypothetical protein ACI65C_007753 [Semiaphis heraclei]
MDPEHFHSSGALKTFEFDTFELKRFKCRNNNSINDSNILTWFRSYYKIVIFNHVFDSSSVNHESLRQVTTTTAVLQMMLIICNIKISSMWWVLYDERNTCDRALETHTRDRGHARSDGHVPADRRRREERLATVRNAREILCTTRVYGYFCLVGGKSTVLVQPNEVAIAGVSVPAADGHAVIVVRRQNGIIADRRLAATLSHVSGRSPPVKLAHKNGQTRK